MLAQIDSQALLTYDNLTGPGHYSDMDMLQIGNIDHGHTLTIAESRSQLAIWAVLGSPLILGNDPRNMTDDIKELLTNTELIATLSKVRDTELLRALGRVAMLTACITGVVNVC